MSNVIKPSFSRPPYTSLQELYDKLREVLDDHASDIPAVSVIGVLVMLQQHLISEVTQEAE